jgi:uncharacterized membrane protein YeaQ/YmgE (transglycosylase-associated protein family)
MLMSGVALAPGGVVGWIIVGLLAGAIASHLVRGRGYGCLLDIVVGVVGAFIGGLIVGLFVPYGTVYGFWGSLIVAIVGAVVLLGVLRLLVPGRR